MKSPPVARLDPVILEQFLSLCRQTQVDAGTMIIKSAEIPDRLYYLVEGSVEVIIEDDSGHDMVLAYLNKGHFFGEMAFFNSRQAQRSAWVRSRTDVVIAEMGYEEFRQLTTEHQGLVFELTTQMALRLFGADMKVSSLAFLDVKGRVAHTLLELCYEPDAHIRDEGWFLEISRPQLARLVGCSREMVCRVLKMLQSEGLIVYSAEGIVVHGTHAVPVTA
ncbi:MAG: cyclic nucleotide-binding domain-containing protein [Gammaproteobacteria bacterium]|nr:cyclic nucleotide-binding domain-containing protein [Gammaproteobacteria bacterium]NND59724.1 cyclic nucleotide-binding domain-containing protein [Gammaproteobacteria bacterium]